MENQSVMNPNISVNPAPVAQQPNSPIAKTSSIMPTLLTLVISGVLFGTGGYYLGMQRNSQVSVENQRSVASNLPQPTIQLSTTSTPTEPSTPPEIGNVRMKEATKVISGDGKQQLWLDGQNFTATQLWISNVDETQKKLIVVSNSAQTAKVGDYSLVSPVWNPEGTQIAYLRAVIDNVGQLDVTDKLDLYIIDANGTSDHLLRSNVSTSRGQYGKTDLKWTTAGLSYTDYSSSATGTKVTVPTN